MNPIDERVLLATLDEGGSTALGSFSIIHIAQASGVSEFVILDHFKTREKLLLEAGNFLGEHLSDEMKKVVAENLTPEEAFSALVDFQLAHPTWNGFLLNYSYAVPQFNPDKDQEAIFNERLIDGALRLRKFFPGSAALPSQHLFRLYRYFVRNLIAFCQTLITGENEDSPALRASEASFLFQGLSCSLQGVLAKDNT
jgi:AcrR family transcriptional regulator